jgi:hypothetical protein
LFGSKDLRQRRKVDLQPGAGVKKIDVNGPKVLACEVSAEYEPAQLFEWLKP